MGKDLSKSIFSAFVGKCMGQRGGGANTGEGGDWINSVWNTT